MIKALLTLSVLFVAGFASITSPVEMSSMWEAWKTQHGKSYSALEETARFGIFSHNYKKIQKFNDENDTPQLAMNKFGDLTGAEFKSRYVLGGLAPFAQEGNELNVQNYQLGSLPASVDWRNKGAVTAVTNQGECGACWAFSAVGVLEGYNFINNGGQLLDFSEQQLVDCDTNDGNQGCDGGYPYLAIAYGAKNGLETETDYPYTGNEGTCKYDASKAHKTGATNYALVTANSTDQLKSALVGQPVSVNIECDQDVFQFYNSGVIKLNCGAEVDHTALAVGYHKVGALEAIIVKMFWGADWGDAGYVQIWDSQTVNGGAGVCGILTGPAIAV